MSSNSNNISLRKDVNNGYIKYKEAIINTDNNNLTLNIQTDSELKTKTLYPTSNNKFDPVSIVMFLGTDKSAEELYNFCRDYYDSFGNKDFEKCVDSLYYYGNK